MNEIEIHLSNNTVSRCEQAIEYATLEKGLELKLKTTLKQYPGCIHWHYKFGKERGVLEITFWPQEWRAWISVHDNRKGVWMDSVLPTLITSIKRSLYGH